MLINYCNFCIFNILNLNVGCSICEETFMSIRKQSQRNWTQNSCLFSIFQGCFIRLYIKHVFRVKRKLFVYIMEILFIYCIFPNVNYILYNFYITLFFFSTNFNVFLSIVYFQVLYLLLNLGFKIYFVINISTCEFGKLNNYFFLLSKCVI